MPSKVHLIKAMFFPISCMDVWELDYKESWAPKNWCFWTVVLEKTLESLLDCKEIQPVHPQGDQSWVFIGRTNVEAEAPIVWPPDAKNWLIWKDPDAGKDWRQEEKGTTEGEMVRWHHWLNRHEFGQTPAVGDGQGGLACCGSWGHKELDTTKWLNWTELNKHHLFMHLWGRLGSPNASNMVGWVWLQAMALVYHGFMWLSLFWDQQVTWSKFSLWQW